MAITNSQTGGADLVGATGNPTTTANSSASAASAYDGLSTFAAGFVNDILHNAENALTNAGVQAGVIAPSSTSNATATKTPATSYVLPVLLAVAVFALIWYERKKA